MVRTPTLNCGLRLALVGLTSVGLLACRREPSPASRAAPSASPASAPLAPSVTPALANARSPAPLDSAAVPAPAAAPAPAAVPALAATREHCIALGQSRKKSLGSLQDERYQLHVEDGQLYVLSFTHNLARVRWSRVSRGGGQLTTLAEQKGLGEVSVLAASKGAAYYTQAGKLIKLGPEPGASQTLHESAHSPVALHGDRAFFIDCDRKGTFDRLQELPTAGGPLRTLAELAHPPGRRCQYPSLVADEREVLVADWSEQRVLAVSRQDGAQRTLAAKKGFPQALLLESNAVTFLTARGLERTDRAGANQVRLLDNEIVAAPFSNVILRDKQYWLSDQLAYINPSHIFRLEYDGGKPHAVLTFGRAGTDPNVETDYAAAFAVDDQCLYWAFKRAKAPAVELLAQAK